MQPLARIDVVGGLHKLARALEYVKERCSIVW